MVELPSTASKVENVTKHEHIYLLNLQCDNIYQDQNTQHRCSSSLP